MDILHCDLNNFYASVECAENPALQGKFVAVSGNPEHRHGIILAKNQLAKQAGVKTGEPIWQAKQKCPELVCVPPQFELYSHYSKKVREIYLRYTDKVEAFGLDECWLDVTHSKAFGTPLEIAEKIREQVKQETGLTISVGVSFTKTFAKLGSDLKKPDAVTVVSRQNYKQIIWPLDVCEMLYIGAKTKAKLNSMGIFTLGDLANANTSTLKNKFGVNGVKIQQCARGEDYAKVSVATAERVVKSVGHGTTTIRDMTTRDDIEKIVVFLSEMVATRLRKYGLMATTVHLDLRNTALQHVTMQRTLRPTFVASDISCVAMQLVEKLWDGNPLRSLTVSTANLIPVSSSIQESLFELHDERKQSLEIAIDQIRKKYGFFAIKKANLLGNDLVCDKFSDDEDLIPFKRQ